MYKLHEGNSDDNSFVPSAGKEIFVLNSGDDTIDCNNTDSYGDKIKLLGSRADVSYTKDDNDLIITYSGGTVTMHDYYESSCGYYGNIITEDDAEDFSIDDDIAVKGIYVNYNDELYKIYEGSGDDEFTPTEAKEIFVANGGNDAIVDGYYGNTSNDKIQLSCERADVSYSRNGNNLIMTYGPSGSQSFSLNGVYGGSEGYDFYYEGTVVTMVDEAEFSITDDIASKGYYVTIGDVQYKQFDGTGGDDTFAANGSYEIYVPNGGNDSFNSVPSSDSKIILPCYRDDVTYSVSPNDNTLIISYGDATVSIPYGYAASNGYNSFITTSIITTDDEFNLDEDFAEKGVTNIYGTDDADNFTVDQGNTNVYARKGDDEINFGPFVEDSTLFFTSGDGNDTIFMNGSYNECNSTNTLKFTNAQVGDMTFSADGNALKIQYTNNDSVTINDWFNEGYVIDKVVDSENVNLYSQLDQLRSDVMGWMTANGSAYETVTDAINNTDNVDVSQLVAYFENFNNSLGA